MTPQGRRWTWIAACAGTAAALAAIAGAVAFHRVADPGRLTAQAREKARTAWGRELEIGSLALQLLPRPAVRAEKIALANPPWAKAAHFLVAEQVTAAFELLPLLSGRLEVKSVDIRGAVLDIEEGEDGTTMPARQDAPTARPSPAHVPFPSLHYLRLEDVRIAIRPRTGEPVTWDIPTAQVETDGELREVRFEGEVARAGHPAQVEGRIRDASRYGNEGATSAGHLRIKTETGTLQVEGTLPLHKAWRGHAVQVRAKGTSMAELLAFAGIERRPSAPFELAFDSRDLEGSVAIDNLRFTLGAQSLAGELRVSRGGRPRIEGRLASERIDWAKAFADSGGVARPDPPTDKLYSDRPMAWGFVEALKGKEGAVALSIASLRLRSGIELRNARATATFRDARLELKPFEAQLLGGSARGSFAFDAARKAVRIEMNGERVSFERWLKERGSKLSFSGGPMTVKASIAGAGESMQDVAASITGPITLRMGPGRFHSEHAGEMEQLMTNAFAAKGSGDVAFECAAASLAFRNGRASGQKIVGFRTAASRLLTSGTVDFREGKVELRGKLSANKGVTLGLSTLADDVVISGPVRAPRIALDESATGTALARVGAAIATVGVSVIGTAIAEAASTKADPCEVVMGSDPRAKRGSDP